MRERPYRLIELPVLPDQRGWLLGMPIITDPEVPVGTVEFRDRTTGKLLVRIVNVDTA